MPKYNFLQEGGQISMQPQFDYGDTDFLNNLVDNATQQLQTNNKQAQQNNSVGTNQQSQESDYITNLRAYDTEQETTNSQQENIDLTKRLDLLEKNLKMQMNNLQDQFEQQSWLSSDDGISYMSNLYDSQKYGNNAFTPSVPESLQQRQLNAESGGYDKAVSPKGAMGAYQFMPQTWEEYKPSPNASPFNRADAEYAYNKYMGALLNQFGNDQRKATAAYNAGPGRVQRLINQYGDNWEQHLPQETKGYLKEIFNNPTTENIPLKAGASLQGVNNGILNIVNNVVQQYPGLVITSGTDGKHLPNSAHYDGDAVDIGANSSTKQAYNAFKQNLPELKQKYGIKYLDEGDHIHVSLSSKGKT